MPADKNAVREQRQTIDGRRFRLLLVLAMILSGDASLFAGELPSVSVTGPLPQTAESHAFGGAAYTRVPSDLEGVGYVEEEFLASGLANVYDWPRDGAAVVRSSDVPYTTRVLVRRPVERARFSGNVIVEMLNPSNLFDLNIGWALSHARITRHGDAWVGITAKPIAVEALKTFDPERYGSLSWPNPLPADDPRNCSELRRDSRQETENGLIWDIHRQVGSWLKSGDPSNPVAYGVTATAAHPVEHLYAWGYSQTGSFLYTYLGAIHPLDVKALGRPLFDGYLVAVSSGPAPIHQCAERLPADDPRRGIRNAGVPVFRIMSQSDYLRSVSRRLPNSDKPPNLTRNYEIAGSGHATPDELYYAARPEDIEKAGRDVPPMACNEGRRSRFPISLFFNAALAHLDRWVRDGKPPPPSAQIEVEDGEPVLDEHGNVRGGVRSPYVDVPTSTWSGNSTGASFCFIAGHETPFPQEKLKQLYPGHEAYVAAVRQNVDQLITAGHLLAADAFTLIREAEEAPVP